jgi:hypothetical protein
MTHSACATQPSGNHCWKLSWGEKMCCTENSDVLHNLLSLLRPTVLSFACPHMIAVMLHRPPKCQRLLRQMHSGEKMCATRCDCVGCVASLVGSDSLIPAIDAFSLRNPTKWQPALVRNNELG